MAMQMKGRQKWKSTIIAAAAAKLLSSCSGWVDPVFYSQAITVVETSMYHVSSWQYYNDGWMMVDGGPTYAGDPRS